MRDRFSILFKILFSLCILSFVTSGIAQVNKDLSGKIFWTQDFSLGRIPDGWIVKTLNDSSISWACTDQPYPGSFGHDQQAPPIASGSGGYHMQYAPGTKVDKNYRKWNKAGIWPDGYFQTSAINCSDKHSVVLKFKQNFMWNDWGGVRPDGGLFVGVSNDGRRWKEYEVRNKIGSEIDCPNPVNVEINITEIASLQDSVYLRFFWRGIYAWYWMIDDIEVSEALDVDLSASELISHPETGNHFSKQEAFTFDVVNLGAYAITKPFDCYLVIDSSPPQRATVPFSKIKSFNVIDTVKVTFPPVDLTDYGIHNIRFYTSLPEDKRNTNDTLSLQLFSQAYELGKVTGFSTSGDSFVFDCNHARVMLNFYRDDIFRIQMSYNGVFTNPAGNDIIINVPSGIVNVGYSDHGNYYLFQTSKIALRAYKDPLRFAMYQADNSTLCWEETRSLSYGEETVQYLKRGEKEYFYGGGMQNGRFSLRDKTIQLRIDWNWEDGGNPNPSPFYMSTNGYAALRNTYAPGEYSFTDTLKLKHSEPRFDCYYFAGNDLKDLLNSYTTVSGRPFLPPRWALSMGDANCYNRGAKKSKNTTGFNGTTPDVIPLVADKYIENRIPRGWILPNDGYGCGYTKLDSVIIELSRRGFHTGLWTENGVDKIAKEVGDYGSRVCKLDVAWIGNGYKFAIDGCKAAYEGIEKNSNARGFVWSVCGWAGTQRNSVVWTGDQAGSWNYIRWHIPTVIGSGLSALNCATGDIDGIFGGSDKTYTRDLQWKCFTPVLMSMSGWAPKDKQPYIYGEPFTSINRKYLMLKLQLTPYMYTLCAEAWETGLPSVRGLVLEYPNDPVTWGDQTKYEFLLGKNFLIAPVFKDEQKRDSIYLPKDNWFDYWDGKVYGGPITLNNYPAPLEKLPLFVKAGSVIPLYTERYFDNERLADTLILDIYPGANTEFIMYEDDGSSRDYRQNAFTKTGLVMHSNELDKVSEIKILASKGNFQGKIEFRKYLLQIHNSRIPSSIKIQKAKLKKLTKREEFDEAEVGWYIDSNDPMKILHIKTAKLTTANDLTINVSY